MAIDFAYESDDIEMLKFIQHKLLQTPEYARHLWVWLHKDADGKNGIELGNEFGRKLIDIDLKDRAETDILNWVMEWDESHANSSTSVVPTTKRSISLEDICKKHTEDKCSLGKKV
jgi:hypothetical protein